VKRMQELDFNFVLEDKYIYVTKKGGKETNEVKGIKGKDKGNKKVQKETLMVKSPYLKVLKACHEFKSRYYLIVQLDMDLDVDEKVEKFVKEIRNMDEMSKEVLMQNSMTWYGKKWDIFTLDSMTRCPIDEQKGIFYMKILIEKENRDLWKRVQTLEKLMESEPNNIFISMKTSFKGLRWSREVFSEEWYLEDFYVLEEEKEILDHLFQDGDDMTVVPISSYSYSREETPQETPQEIVQEEASSEVLHQETPQEIVQEEAPQEVLYQETPQEIVQEIAQEIAHQEIVQEIAHQEIVQEIAHQEMVQLSWQTDGQQRVAVSCQEEAPQEVVHQETPQEILHQEVLSMEKSITRRKKGDFRKKDDGASVVSALSTTSSKRVKKVFTLNGKLIR
jgi:hypothetical protein